MNTRAMLISLSFLFMLSIGQVHFLDALPGKFFEVYVNYLNTGTQDAKNAHIVLMIPELEIYDYSNTFDIDDHGNGVSILFPYIPPDTKPGWYQLWTTLSNDDYRTWQFDWFYVASAPQCCSTDSAPCP